MRVNRSGEAAVQVLVRDDGNGLPPSFYLQNGGLGMTIINAFVEQSGAKLEIRHPVRGAEFAVEIPF